MGANERALPSGVVTFCFTDVEDSTKLFARLGGRYESVLSVYHQFVRDAAASHGGVEVKTEGDGCFLAFSDAARALEAAVTLQRALKHHAWPDGTQPHVRVGIHTGRARPSDGDYISLAVHEAARVADSANGGQILVTGETVASLGSSDLRSLHLIDLGEYRLRSFDQPCRLYQLAVPDLRRTFPPLRARSAVKKAIRIFVALPGDLHVERETSALTIERLAKDYARHFEIEPCFWDADALVVDGKFRDPAETPGSFDIVICILWARLGELMPEATALRRYTGVNGDAPISGIEWAYADATKALRESGAPDVLLLRNCAPVMLETRDLERRKRGLDQLDAVDEFWTNELSVPHGEAVFFAEFSTRDQFAELLEQHLRKLIDRRVHGASPDDGGHQDKTWQQVPFRGLESYEFEHAPIFFGQDEALSGAMLQLLAGSDRGTAFLNILGASGSGKSSLVKAGILPKLFVPRRVTGRAFLRRTVFRPSDRRDGETLFEAFARRLATRSSEGEGLPELTEHAMPLSTLAESFRSGSAGGVYPIQFALAKLADAARSRGKMLETETATLALVVDQLEELFVSKEISDGDRLAFIDLLHALACSGFVWVVTTMRSDFWHRAAETPNLVRLSEGTGRLELLPPTPAQIAQIIRRPAASAGISFEVDHDGVPLDDRIAEDVGRDPTALPLLSYLLDQLYRTDVLEQHGDRLTFATYEHLGRLEGAIATKADGVLRACSPQDRLALPSVLFQLVQLSDPDGAIEHAVARRVPLSSFSAGSAQRRLVEALLSPDARLLVVDAELERATPTVRVAHEALISRWSVARNFVRGNAEALKIRRRIEERFALWRSHRNKMRGPDTAQTFGQRLTGWLSGFGHEEGLLTDIDLTDGKRLLREHGTDVEPEVVAFIERSAADDRRIRNRSVQALGAAVCVVSLLAALALWARNDAVRAGNAARDQRAQAEGLVEFMLGDLRSRLEPSASLSVLSAVGNKALDYYAHQAQASLDADALGRRARVLHMLGEVANERGDLASALKVFEQAASSTKELLARDPDNPSRIFEHAQSVFWVGSVAFSRGQLDLAEAQFREYLRLATELIEKGGKKDKWLAEIGYANLDLGTVYLSQNRDKQALAAFRSALSIEDTLVRHAPGDRGRLLDEAQGLAWEADTDMRLGAVAEARSVRQREQSIYLDLLKRSPGDRPTIEALVFNRDKLAAIMLASGQFAQAVPELKQAVSEIAPLLTADPENDDYRGAALGAFLYLGEAYLQLNELDRAEEAAASAKKILDTLVRTGPNVIEWKGTQLGNLRLLEVRIASARSGDPKSCRIALTPAVAEAQRLKTLIEAGTPVPALTRTAAKSLILLGDYEFVAGRVAPAESAWNEAASLLKSAFAAQGGVADVEARQLLDVIQSAQRKAGSGSGIIRATGPAPFHCSSI